MIFFSLETFFGENRRPQLPGDCGAVLACSGSRKSWSTDVNGIGSKFLCCIRQTHAPACPALSRTTMPATETSGRFKWSSKLILHVFSWFFHDFSWFPMDLETFLGPNHWFSLYKSSISIEWSPSLSNSNSATTSSLRMLRHAIATYSARSRDCRGPFRTRITGRNSKSPE